MTTSGTVTRRYGATYTPCRVLCETTAEDVEAIGKHVVLVTSSDTDYVKHLTSYSSGDYHQSMKWCSDNEIKLIGHYLAQLIK